MPDTTLCLVCKQRTFTRPIPPHIDNVRVCVDFVSCFTEWLRLLSEAELVRLRSYVVAQILHDNTKLGPCAECKCTVYNSSLSSYVYMGDTDAYVHYACFVSMATRKLTEAL